MASSSKKKGNPCAKGRPNPKRKYKTMTDIEIANKRNFIEAAWKQRVCQQCGRGGPYQAHHVIEKSYLKRNFLLSHVWDTRNAMRLCNDCHEAHTNGSKRVEQVNLLPCNYEFAFDILGAAAYYELERKYRGEDARLSEHLTRWEDEHAADTT